MKAEATTDELLREQLVVLRRIEGHARATTGILACFLILVVAAVAVVLYQAM